MTSTRMISNDKSGEKNRPTIDRYRGQIYDVTVSKKKKKILRCLNYRLNSNKYRKILINTVEKSFLQKNLNLPDVYLGKLIGLHKFHRVAHTK